MAAARVLVGAAVALTAALAVVIDCHFDLSPGWAASPQLLDWLGLVPLGIDSFAGSFVVSALLVVLAAGSFALATGKLEPSRANMPTPAPPSPVGDGSKSPGARLRHRFSVAPSSLAGIIGKHSTDKSTTSEPDAQPDDAVSAGPSLSDLQSTSAASTPPPPATTGSTLRVTEISVGASIVDDSGTTAADPVPKAIDVPLNHIPEPHAFENEFVRGKLLFMIDSNDSSVPEPVDVRARFEGRRRLFWVQVQLQFKQAPSGIVYIGGEVPRPMSLGFFTGGMTKIILSVLQSLVPGLHYSFGHSDRDDASQGDSGNSDRSGTSEADDEELPHICFPLYTAVDQFVVTPPGQTPPTLGSEDFGETKEQSQQRRRSGLVLYPFNTRDTYSFHFHSYFIDFAHWQLINLPGLRNTDLRVFWDDMPLRIVCYSLNDSSRTRSDTLRKAADGVRSFARRGSYAGGSSATAKNAKKAAHSWATKEYKFCLELSPQDPNAIPLSRVKSAAVPDTALTAFGTPSDATAVEDTQFLLKRLHEVHRELSRFEIRIPAWFEYFSHTRTHSERRVGYVIAVRTISASSSEDDEDDGGMDHDDEQQGSMLSKLGHSKPDERRQATGEYVLLHTALVAFTPLSFVERELSGRGVRSEEDNGSSSEESLGPLDCSSETARSGSGNGTTFSTARQLFGNRSRSVEDSISVRSRSLRYNKIDDERQFLEHQLQLLAAVAPGARIGMLPEQLCAAKSSLLELLQSRQSPSALEIEWPFLSAHCTISSSDVFTRSNKDDVSMLGKITRANFAGASFDTAIRPASPPRSGRSCQSVQVLRVILSTQWRNEWMTLHPAGHTLRFFRTQSSSCKLSIAVDQVLTISMGSPAFSSCWCRSHYRDAEATVVESMGDTALYWLHIGLVEKCHHVAFASPKEQEKWFDLLSGSFDTSSPGSPKLLPSVVPIMTRTQPVLDLLLKQPIIRSTARLTLDSFVVNVRIGGGNGSGHGKARLTKRFVLNERCLVRLRGVCSCTLTESSRGEFDAVPDAGDLVRRCLRHAVKLQSIRLDNFSTVELLRFHDSVCALRWVDPTPLLRETSSVSDASGGDISSDYDAENERKAFFLNLFHLMMIHASILGLLPKSKTKWSKFFNGVTYNIGGMYFSLAEVEHGILRAAMSPLRLPITVLVIPRLGKPEVDPRALFRLQRPDFRLNFAMNCMTRSCWMAIAVFDRAHIDEQLDRVVSETIARSLLYDRANHVVQLPKVCDWYRDDFCTGDSQTTASAAAESVPRALTTNHAILGLLLRFVRGPELQLLEYAWQHPLGLVDKYTFEKYDYRFQDALVEAPPLIDATGADDADT